MTNFPAPGSIDIALSMQAHDRVGLRRTDARWLEETWGDPNSRVVLLANGKFPVADSGTAIDWRRTADVPVGQRIFLGVEEGVPRFAVLLSEADESSTEDWSGFRAVAPRLSDDDAGWLVHAIALAEWHTANRHCPRCGGRLVAAAAGHVLTCSVCGKEHFPRTDPAVIMLVTDGERALLGRSPAWPEGRFSTLAGFVEPGEGLEQAVVREVAEEVGIDITDVTYFGNQPWPFPASLMVGFFAHAVTSDIHVDGEEISDARWFTRETMSAEAESGSLILPGGISIARALVEAWYGAPLPGSW